ncbi:hypothetical protein B0J13DRAFT_484766 [Dactylonectria estremocensis]|uniref:HNH nuclease domain-containing protein n=1 Tax=Dactylonectria estremocensis TaxID=1079267 RepID=A0A9P9DQC3_9HYPO|nr:hypothetical protein B0J13DRAFT_484766 [Dactylonectria estremocensis]
MSQTQKDVKKTIRKLKRQRQTSVDAECWEEYSEIFQLQQDQVIIQYHLALRAKQVEPETTEDDVREDTMAQLGGWSQLESIAETHTRGHSNWFNLFATSKLGLDLEGGVTRRDTGKQIDYAAAMVKAYCPDPIPDDIRWDPVLSRWVEGGDPEAKNMGAIHAVHLFPWAQVDVMDDIFGKGTAEEIYSPLNGIFLHHKIAHAFEKGYIAIVPDVDPERQDERRHRSREWESQPIKEYKVIVVSQDPAVAEKINFDKERYGMATLQELHGRKLVFKTDFRPGARYLWWAFLNTILRTAWASDEKTVHHAGVRNVTQYWGICGRYVMQNQLLGFVEELGQDADGILEHGIEDEGDKEPNLCAVSVAVCDAIERSVRRQKGDEDDEDDRDE